MLARWLDRVLFRQPFEGRGARSYATAARPAFGDLDHRILEGMSGLAQARFLLDLGAGPGTFASLAAARHPRLQVIAIEPSRDYARHGRDRHVVRASGEALPLATASVDAAICLSSLRHVRDRRRTLRELRRVVRPGAPLLIVELDPAATPAQIRAHTDGLGSMVLRHAFGPLVCKTAPPSSVIADLAIATGWRVTSRRADPIQPVYLLELR